MADIKRLATMLKELDDQLVGCMRCGMCQAVCPVFKESGRESDVARGKLALLDGLASELLRDPESVNKRLNKCLLCGTCEANCPSGVKATDIFLRARAILTGYLGLPPAQKAIFRGMLANPKLMNNLIAVGAKFQGLFTKEVDNILGSSCARFQAPVIGDRHFKRLADKPLHSMVAKLDTAPGKSGKTVAFFPGCVVDKIFPSVGQSVLKVLEHHGVGVFMPAEQGCCGIPALSSGETETFEKLVRQNLQLFRTRTFDYLITPCATCTSTIKKVWPKFYKAAMDERGLLREMADKAMDVSQFLVDVLGVHPAEVAGGKKVTYHDPCHLKNSLGVTAQPRTVLKAAGCQYVEMNDAGVCCGCGGSFNIKHYGVSSTIGAKKAQNIIASGADVAATSCPACMLQITDMLSKAGKSMPVRHAIEIYADSLK